jgi:hypothetical protein
VGGAGVALAGALVPARRLEIGTGIAVSWLHQLVVTALTVFGTDSQGVRDVAPYLSGYDSSGLASALHGRGRRRGRRAVRGFGAAESILPMYSGGPGMRQAAAGLGRRGASGLGEYFATNGLGEYFAGPNLRGVGSYESAGPLAMQAAAGVGVIDDGIRPDSNLDNVLKLAEAAAGMGGPPGYVQASAGMGAFVRRNGRGVRGLGEFFSASPGGGTFSVPPGDDEETSELPAGTLATSGGNGIFG